MKDSPDHIQIYALRQTFAKGRSLFNEILNSNKVQLTPNLENKIKQEFSESFLPGLNEYIKNKHFDLISRFLFGLQLHKVEQNLHTKLALKITESEKPITSEKWNKISKFFIPQPISLAKICAIFIELQDKDLPFCQMILNDYTSKWEKVDIKSEKFGQDLTKTADFLATLMRQNKYLEVLKIMHNTQTSFDSLMSKTYHANLHQKNSLVEEVILKISRHTRALENDSFNTATFKLNILLNILNISNQYIEVDTQELLREWEETSHLVKLPHIHLLLQGPSDPSADLSTPEQQILELAKVQVPNELIRGYQDICLAHNLIDKKSEVLVSGDCSASSSSDH